jgi:hypothetical protein
MKMAEALAEKSDLDKRIKQNADRIRNAARYVEEEGQVEDPAELLAKTRALMEMREHLVRRINLANAANPLYYKGVNVTVTAALALRERLNAERKLLNETAEAASPERDSMYSRRRRTELAEKTDLPVKELRAEADRLARLHRELDTLIQQSNWSSDLI